MFRILFQVLRRQAYFFLRLKPINALGRTVLSKVKSPWLYKRKYIFPVRGTIKVRYPQGKDFLMFSDGSDMSASQAFFGGALAFEDATSSVLTKYFQQGGTFFDIGANSGIFSLMAATFPQIKEVHAFEPMSAAFQMLQRNVTGNQFKKVRLNKLALGDAEGEIDLAVPKGILLPTGSSETGSAKFDDFSAMDHEKPPLSTLDNYMKRHGIQSCDLIKIDTETTEPAVIRGGRETIAKFRPKIVCEIIRDQAAHEIESLFRGSGYSFFHLTAEGPVKVTSLCPNLKYMNFLFLPPESGI